MTGIIILHDVRITFFKSSLVKDKKNCEKVANFAVGFGMCGLYFGLQQWIIDSVIATERHTAPSLTREIKVTANLWEPQQPPCLPSRIHAALGPFAFRADAPHLMNANEGVFFPAYWPGSYCGIVRMHIFCCPPHVCDMKMSVNDKPPGAGSTPTINPGIYEKYLPMPITTWIYV